MPKSQLKLHKHVQQGWLLMSDEIENHKGQGMFSMAQTTISRNHLSEQIWISTQILDSLNTD